MINHNLFLSYPNKEHQQVNPKQVNKMPVGAHDLNQRCIVCTGVAEILPGKDHNQRNNPTKYVQSMQAEDDV